MSTPLENLGQALTYKVDTGDALEGPAPRLGQAHRTVFRSLSTMQKEALVTSTLSGETWRMASDEGPYLDAADVAPNPLAFMVTGMVCSFADGIKAFAERRGVDIENLELVLDNPYRMSGSALKGTMTGSALRQELEVTVSTDASPEVIRELAEAAVDSSPINGLLSAELPSRFTLVHNGVELTTGQVDQHKGDPLSDPGTIFEAIEPTRSDYEEPIIRHMDRMTEAYDEADDGYTDPGFSTLRDRHDRIVHLNGTCQVQQDGLKTVEQRMYSPRGSIFELRSDEPVGHGGEGRAPDAMSYAAASIGFCFMTQLSRYSELIGEDLTSSRIVQDTHFSANPWDLDKPTSGEAQPVESHVHVDTEGDDEFARELLDMAEQACYLHALCRASPLDPEIRVNVR